MNNIRNKRQFELGELWWNNGKFGIINAAARSGKCFITIGLLERHYPSDVNVLIAYPDKNIRKGWEEDFKKNKYNNPNIKFITFASLKKVNGEEFDLFVIDEIHLLSPAQMAKCHEIFMQLRTKHVLGLTGTLSKHTEYDLRVNLGLKVVAIYTTEQAIKEGVVPDYEINVIQIPLDNKIPLYKGKTEKKKFDNLSYIIDKLESEGKETFFMRLQRMRIIQNSIAKLEKTKQLIQQFKHERILVFCGVTKIADNIGIPSFHSKSSKKDVIKKFANGEGNHLAVVKLGNSGVTYLPLNKVILNSFDSNAETFSQRVNRCMSLEYNNLEKKAQILIITTNEPTELNWLKRALEMFDKQKIKYL